MYLSCTHKARRTSCSDWLDLGHVLTPAPCKRGCCQETIGVRSGGIVFSQAEIMVLEEERIDFFFIAGETEVQRY